MVYRFYGKYGELPRVKLWTKTGEKEFKATITSVNPIDVFIDDDTGKYYYTDKN